MKDREIIWKEVGETPLEALERYRATQPELAGLPMTYAGRLDPMAEGQLLILIGEECKNKEKYLGLDKEYEVEIVFGMETDTYDALGRATVSLKELLQTEVNIEKCVGKFTQEYPPYSSKTFNGKQLHALARAGELPDEMPTKEVEIYSISLLEQKIIDFQTLLGQVVSMINKVKGDFRQEEIKQRWEQVLNGNKSYPLIRIKVKCSSGTYMRSLAHKIGKDMKAGAFALTIKRIKIEF